MDSPVSTCPDVDARSRGPHASGLRLLPNPVTLDCYELRGVIGEGTAATVYLGTDRTLRVPVAIREYMPSALAVRDATSRVVPLSPACEIPFARGLQAFIEEARTLARCDHPSLLRIVRLLEANGTAYSVMPHYVGRRLTDVRRDATSAIGEDALRALLGDLLGALEAFHAFGNVHGGVSPDNVLLLQNGRPVLLRPRARSREAPGEPIDTLSGYLQTCNEAEDASVGGATGAWADVHDAARVIRFLMGSGSAGHPTAAGDWGGSARDEGGAAAPIAPNARYSVSFLEALDAAESPLPERRPQSVGEFREWLKETSRSHAAVVGAPSYDGAAPAEDVSVRESEGDTAPETLAGLSERDRRAETVDPGIASRARSGWDARTRRMALKSAVLLGIVAVPAVAIWLLNHPPVAIHGWSRALVPPSLIPSRNAPRSDATAVAALSEAASQARSPRALESVAVLPQRPADAARDGAPTVGDLAAQGAPIQAPTNPEPATTAPATPGVLPQTEVAAALSLPVAPVARQSPPTAAPALQAAQKQGSPRELCAPRSQFALYRCMQTQCSSPRWSHHPQCIRLRSTDEVE